LEIYERADTSCTRESAEDFAAKWDQRAAFFGSIVRGEMTDESDIEYPC
jgi:predicted nucleotidyltransferase